MIRKQSYIYLAIMILFTSLYSCSKRQGDEVTPANPAPGKAVTYSNFTQALIQTSCSGCHATGRSAASIWTFNGLASITNNETRIKRVVLTTRSMPMGSSLTAEQLKSLQEWFDNKMPE